MKIRKNIWPWLYGLVLTLFTVYVLLDAFIIPRTYAAQSDTVVTAQSLSSKTTAKTTAKTVTDTSYSDGNITIKITQYRENDTNVYVADVTLKSADSLKTAFAQGTYGKNITETTSAIAEEAGAILAINGDYYSARRGYVIRNGTLYRSTSAGSDQQDLVIYQDGSCKIITEGSVTAQELLSDGAQQVLSFGPALVENGAVSVSENEEVGRAKTSNPRTAIGVIDALHYVFVVSDGRTSESAGLSLYQLASLMKTLGVTTAYNLDGGGSSTMVFNGTVVNQPTTDGRTIRERKVSDIVCIG
jgi:exopolysaccharide biosynthesis protein